MLDDPPVTYLLGYGRYVSLLLLKNKLKIYSFSDVRRHNNYTYITFQSYPRLRSNVHTSTVGPYKV